ncbi:MAG: hypothetical protein MZV65_30105 [Chromatiales bacterium]|nr:hypothetical protein [Chromatiales bacterium]
MADLFAGDHQLIGQQADTDLEIRPSIRCVGPMQAEREGLSGITEEIARLPADQGIAAFDRARDVLQAAALG